MSNLYKKLLENLEKADVVRRTYLESGIDVLYQNNSIIFSSSDSLSEEQTESYIKSYIKPSMGHYTGPYIEETIKPEPELVFFGAGHVALALYKIARIMEMKVSVIDERVEVCNKERFPDANLIVDKYENILNRDLGFFRPYYVIFTHGHKYDNQCLRYSIRHNNSYVGMIGSKGKVTATLDNLRMDGFTEEELSKVYSPIGLEIGAVTPEEIAISIMAEIISVFRSTKETITLSPDYLKAISEKSGIAVRIIEKHGSAPRSVGSEMFITESSFYGTIGGGAIENKAIEEGKKMLGSNKNIEIQKYNLSSSGDLGMICGGDVTLLFQRIN